MKMQVIWNKGSNYQNFKQYDENEIMQNKYVSETD